MNTEDWLLRPRLTSAPRLRVFCFPFAGGTASAYQGWHAALPPDVDWCPIQLPGRENRSQEPLIGDPQVLLDQIDAALTPLLDRPFVVFGYSMGGLLAHAWVQRLHAQGRPAPVRLVLAACSAPEYPWRIDPETITDAEFTDYLRDLGGTPTEVLAHEELMAMLMPLLRSDFRLVKTLRSGPQRRQEARVSCPIVAVGGKDDDQAPVEHVAAWEHYTADDFINFESPGGHFVWLQPTLRARLLRLLSSAYI